MRVFPGGSLVASDAMGAMGAMSGSSGGAVPPRLSGRGVRALRRLRQCVAERLRLFTGQCRLRATVDDRLRVDAGAGARVEAAQDESAAPRVQQRECEALVPPGVLERIEPDERDLLEGPFRRRLEQGRTDGHLIELAGDGEDLLEMGIEDGLQASSVRSPGQAVESSRQATGPPEEEEDADEEDDDSAAEPDDDGAEIRFDEVDEVDRKVLHGVSRV